MWRIPKIGDRVYAWRPEVHRGVAQRHRVPGVVVDIERPFAWLSGAIHVQMNDTAGVECYGIHQLDEIPREGP